MGIVYPPPSVAPISIVPTVDVGSDLGEPAKRFDNVYAQNFVGVPSETTTTLVDNNDNTFTYTSEDATVTVFDSEHVLSQPVPNTVRLTKPDGTFDDVAIAAGGSDTHVKDTLTTNDATLTTITSLTLAADAMYSIECLIAADGPTGKNYWAKIYAGVRKDGAGVATLVGDPNIIFGQEGSPGYEATVVVSGNDLLIQVKGAAAETVDWTNFYLYTGA